MGGGSGECGGGGGGGEGRARARSTRALYVASMHRARRKREWPVLGRKAEGGGRGEGGAEGGEVGCGICYCPAETRNPARPRGGRGLEQGVRAVAACNGSAAAEGRDTERGPTWGHRSRIALRRRVQVWITGRSRPCDFAARTCRVAFPQAHRTAITPRGARARRDDVITQRSSVGSCVDASSHDRTSTWSDRCSSPVVLGRCACWSVCGCPRHGEIGLDECCMRCHHPPSNTPLEVSGVAAVTVR